MLLTGKPGKQQPTEDEEIHNVLPLHVPPHVWCASLSCTLISYLSLWSSLSLSKPLYLSKKRGEEKAWTNWSHYEHAATLGPRCRTIHHIHCFSGTAAVARMQILLQHRSFVSTCLHSRDTGATTTREIRSFRVQCWLYCTKFANKTPHAWKAQSLRKCAPRSWFTGVQPWGANGKAYVSTDQVKLLGAHWALQNDKIRLSKLHCKPDGLHAGSREMRWTRAHLHWKVLLL